MEGLDDIRHQTEQPVDRERGAEEHKKPSQPDHNLWRLRGRDCIDDLGEAVIALGVGVDLVPGQRWEVQVGNRYLFLGYKYGNRDFARTVRVA